MSHRILYLVGQLGAGGLERQLYYLLQALDRRCYKPAVAVWNFCEQDAYVPQIRALGVPVYALSDQCSRLVKLKALRRLMRKLQPEVLHSYSSFTNFGAWLVAQGTKTVAIGSVRSDFSRAKKGNGVWLGRLSARWPRSQIFNSFAAAELAEHSRSLFAPRRRFIVSNRLDVERFQMVPLSNSGRVRILGIGSLSAVKRWDRLLKAAFALRRKGIDFSVQIAGDGTLRGSLIQLAENLNIADGVQFLGYKDNIPSLLADATFLVHTSDTEGCPNVIMEAMACGRAVVATDVGDVPFLVEEGKTGFVVPRGDEVMLVERIATLCANRGLCSRMGEAGRARAKREFGLDHLVAETLSAYSAAGWQS